MRKSRVGLCSVVVGLALIAALGSPASADGEAQSLVIVFDASGSMWGQVDGEAKIAIARRALGEVAEQLPESGDVALVAYGHRREGDCADVETVLPLAPLDRGALSEAVAGITPRGKTPITSSARQAIDLLQDRDAAGTVILISDGIETCGGDPCAAVAEAKASGVEFVLHVVGFGVEEGDVSQLECTAQAGGGLYFPAADAAELAAALSAAVEAPADPGGRLSVAARADGEPVDAVVRVWPAAGGERPSGSAVASGRTYTGAETNPRLLAVEPGRYYVEVEPVGIRGVQPAVFAEVEVTADEPAERVADFSSGQLAVRITRNGALSDASLRVYRAGTSEEVAAGRTYTGEKSNPRVFELTVGSYDVLVGPIEIQGAESVRIEGLEVKAQDRTDVEREFVSGTLTVGVAAGGEPVDAVVRIYSDGREAARGRSYTAPPSNPRSFELVPGTYTIKAQRVGGDRAKGEITVEVTAGERVERTIEL